jgi:hypothetical protein
MKKSQLRKIIRESIKQLINEQVTCPPGTKQLQMTPCPGSTNAQGAPISGNWYTGGCATIDGQEPNQSHIGTIVHNLSSGHVVKFEVVQIHPEYGNAANPTRHFTTTTCSGGTTGCPGWSGYSNWESNFTSLPNFNSSNPNQPCQFLCQRNTQWSTQIQNVGPNWAAQLQCKIDKVQDLMQTHNCASSNAPAC